MVGTSLESLIKELKLTPEEFGEAVGVGKSPIYKLLRGDVKKITKRMAERINNAFPEYEIDYLLSFNFSENDKDPQVDTSPMNQIVLNEDEKLPPTIINLFEKAVLLKEEDLLESQIISTWLSNKLLVAENKLLKEIKLNKADD